MRDHEIGPRAIACVGLLSLAACAGPTTPESDAPDDWRGEVFEEGTTTTVRNLFGSVWGAPGVLVEEASIGVLEGEEPYMFGQIASVTATREHIIVADRQVPAVRVYDLNGGYLRDLGREGEGPGEFEQPFSVRANPTEGSSFAMIAAVESSSSRSTAPTSRRGR